MKSNVQSAGACQLGKDGASSLPKAFHVHKVHEIFQVLSKPEPIQQHQVPILVKSVKSS